MARMAQRVADFGTTIFSEINTLAAQHQAINLGQGKPDFDGPPTVVQAAAEALLDGRHNQYPPGYGIAALRTAIAQHEQTHFGYAVDPQSEVVVTVGATEAMFAAILGLADPGDEIIIFEPFYDSYVPNIKMAGAVPRYVPLHPPNWHFDRDQLKTVFNEHTRAIIINTPHNPTGKLYTIDELDFIAELCIEHDVIAITDEVYEHIVFDDNVHTSLIARPDMRHRTVKISSLGKTFSVTGWKIGWAIANPTYVTGIQRARQFTTFTAAHPLQVGAVTALQLGADYYTELRAMYQQKRDLLVSILNAAGFSAPTPQGSYFVMADFSNVFTGDAVSFARWLVQAVGVACIPPTFFYSKDHRHIVDQQARFAFCKTDVMLNSAGERLKHIEIA